MSPPALTLPQSPSPDALAAVRQKDLRRQGLLLDDEALLQAGEEADAELAAKFYQLKLMVVAVVLPAVVT